MKVTTTITRKEKKIHELTTFKLLIYAIIISCVLWAIGIRLSYALTPIYLHLFMILSAGAIGQVKMKKLARSTEKKHQMLKLHGMINKKGKVPIDKRLRVAYLKKEKLNKDKS